VAFRYLHETQQVIFSGNATSYSKKGKAWNSPPSFSHSRTGTQCPWGCFSSHVSGSDNGRGNGWEFSTYFFHTWISSYLLHCSVHKFLLKLPCFLWPGACAEYAWAPVQPFPLPLPALSTGRGTEVENPTSSPQILTLCSPMHVPPTPSPNLNALIIVYLWKNPPISMYWFPAIRKAMQKSRYWAARQVGWSCDRDISVTLEFNDKLWIILISPPQSKPFLKWP